MLIGSFLVAQPFLVTRADDTELLLIRNVRLLDQQVETADVTVNILIKDKKLDVVTKDELPAPEGALVVDAQEGILLGKLHVGEPPSFLILDEDPRQNLEALLDTRTHASFAVHEGVIVKNELREMTEFEEEPPRRGWLAYTPPPMALPVSYREEKKWNRWEGKYVSGIFLAAVLMDRQYWISQDDASEQQIGDLEEFDGGEIRGFRLGAVGTLNFKRPWVYTIFAATNAFDKGFDSDRDDDVTFFDYRLDIPLPGKMTLSVGKQKEPISMERITSMIFLPMQERSSVADALLRSRNFGVVMSGTALDQRMTWAGGAFNDSFVTRYSFGNSASQFIGRVTGLPFSSADESNLLHLGFGARYSNAERGFQALTEPEFNNAPVFVDTGSLEAEDWMTYDLEASWRRGPYWLAGEYVWADVDAEASGDPAFSGYHVTGSWVPSGEMHAYNRKSGIFGALSVAQSVYQGGWGAWEVGVRYSDLDLTDGAVDGGEMRILSLGLNWWLSPVFSVSVNYRHVDLDRFGLDGGSHGFNARVLLILE